MPFQVAVCGPRQAGAEDVENAHRVGMMLAERGVVVLCGVARG